MISPRPQQVRNPNCTSITLCQLQMKVLIPGHGTAHRGMALEGGEVALEGGEVALEGGEVALDGGGVALQGGGWHYKEGVWH